MTEKIQEHVVFSGNVEGILQKNVFNGLLEMFGNLRLIQLFKFMKLPVVLKVEEL